MKARVWIEHEVEVEVSADDAICAILGLPEPSRLPAALAAINACYAILKRVPDGMIAAMNDKQREIISQALAVETKRYAVGNAPSTRVDS